MRDDPSSDGTAFPGRDYAFLLASRPRILLAFYSSTRRPGVGRWSRPSASGGLSVPLEVRHEGLAWTALSVDYQCILSALVVRTRRTARRRRPVHQGHGVDST